MSPSGSTDAATILGADALADLRSLEPVAEAVFGRGDRQPGWFARKLVREGVEARLSCLAVAGPRAPSTTKPESARVPLSEILGYALVGRALSQAGIARGSGVGVLAAERGQGLGGRMLERVRERAQAAGCEALEFLAEPIRLPWYRRHGYTVVEEQLTLIAPGLGPREAAAIDLRDPLREPLREPQGDRAEPAASPGPAGAALLWSWIPEIWARSPAHERAYVEREGARMWLTREGRAWLVHRCELADPDALIPGLTALRRELAPTTPLLLYPYPANAGSLPALVEAGFGPAQRSFVVRRTTD